MNKIKVASERHGNYEVSVYDWVDKCPVCKSKKTVILSKNPYYQPYLCGNCFRLYEISSTGDYEDRRPCHNHRWDTISIVPKLFNGIQLTLTWCEFCGEIDNKKAAEQYRLELVKKENQELKDHALALSLQEKEDHRNRPQQTVKFKKKKRKRKKEVKPSFLVKVDGDNDDLECKICFEYKINIAFVPCGHTCCSNCVTDFSVCPLCKKKIKKFQCLFL